MVALNKGPPEEMERTKNGPITWKQLAAGVAILTGLGAAQTAVITPIVRQSVRPVIKEELEQHSKFPHPTSVSRREFELILHRLDAIQSELKELRRER